MSTRTLLNLFLLIFILALVALVVYQPGKEKPVTPPTLTSLKANEINHIQITRPRNNAGDHILEFEKTTNGWILVKPYRHAANTFRLESVLKLLSAVSLSQNKLENLNHEEFGLTKPQATITFNDKVSIIFGNNKSLKHHRYVKIGSTLHMIADTFLYQLTAKTASYVSHKVLPEKSKITKLILPNLKLELVDVKWNITPKTDNFSADSINQLINEWQLTQAYDIIKDKRHIKTKADIIVHLSSEKILRFKMNNTQDDFSLLNIDTGIRYIMAKNRSNKLLNLSGIEKSE